MQTSKSIDKEGDKGLSHWSVIGGKDIKIFQHLPWSTLSCPPDKYTAKAHYWPGKG